MKNIALALLVVIMFVSSYAQTIDETLEQIELVKTELKGKYKEFDETIEEMKLKNPLYAPKNQFESEEEYYLRTVKTFPEIQQLKKSNFSESSLMLEELRSKTFETSNIGVTFGKYDLLSQKWHLTITHTEWCKENYETNLKIDKDTAKLFNDNLTSLSIMGLLTIGSDDSVRLAVVTLKEPSSATELKIQLVNKDEPFFYRTISADGSGDAIAFEMLDRDVIRNIPDYPLDSMTISNDNRYIAGCEEVRLDGGRNVVIYNLLFKKDIAKIEFRFIYKIKSLAFSPYGPFIYVGAGVGNDKTVKVYNYLTNNKVCEYPGVTVVFSPDGRFLATGGYFGSYDFSNDVRVFDLQTNQCISSFKGTSVTFSPDSKLLATKTDYRVLIYDVGNNSLKAAFYHNNFVNSFTFSPDGKYLATVSDEIKLYNIETKSIVDRFNLDYFSPDGKYIAAASGNKKPRMPAMSIPHITFSPDGRYLAYNDKWQRIFLLDY